MKELKENMMAILDNDLIELFSIYLITTLVLVNIVLYGLNLGITL